MAIQLVGYKRIEAFVAAAVLNAGVVALGMGLLVAQAAPAQEARAQAVPATPLALVQITVAHEDDEAHNDCYEFLSQERSDRTGGHLWTERVVEIPAGRVRLLLAVDGKPLSPEQEQQVRADLAKILADPAAFLKREKAEKDNEAQDRQMLNLLPKAFLFDNVSLANGVWRIGFHPDPEFSPSGIQQKVLHGMSGWLTIDARQLRLLHIQASLPQPVSIGFGLLATIRAGSHFSSDRRDIEGHWRTVHVLTDIGGRAILFASVSRSSEITRSDFHYLAPGISIAQAVALVEQQPAQLAAESR